MEIFANVNNESANTEAVMKAPAIIDELNKLWKKINAVVGQLDSELFDTDEVAKDLKLAYDGLNKLSNGIQSGKYNK